MQKIALMNFNHLSLPKYNNFYFIAPQGCSNLPPHQISPVFSLTVENLITHFEKIIEKCHNIKLNNQSTDGLQRVYIQRSRIFRFPDIIAVEFIKLSGTTSSIMLFSHAKYGVLDFGVNRRRLLSWIAALQLAVKNQTA